MNLPTNLFENYTPPSVYLCQPDKEIIGELQVFDFDATFKFNTYSEIQFSVGKNYNDIISGDTFKNPYYDLIDSIRVIYIRGVGHFVIQDVEEDLNENDTKTVSCFSLEYSTSTKYLDTFHVNTGEYESLEYIYHMQQYGNDYSVDNPYKEATSYDPYERYYVKVYTDTNSYNYKEVKIFDETAFDSYEEQLYVKAYPNIRFYNPSTPALSLLHIVFNYIPEWKIGYVDPDLMYQERTFSEDRISVYDFLCETAAETFKYVKYLLIISLFFDIWALESNPASVIYSAKFFILFIQIDLSKNRFYKNWTTIKDGCPIHRMLDIHITKIFLYNRYRRIQSKYQTKSKMVMILSK